MKNPLNLCRNRIILFFLIIIIMPLLNCSKSADNESDKEKLPTKAELKKNEDPYGGIYLYQALFYYGKNDSLLELKIDNGKSFLNIYSVSGNNITLGSSKEIKSFHTNQKSSRFEVIPCVINDNKYRLIYAAVSPESLQENIADSNNDIKGNDLPVSCQDFVSAIGEYRVSKYHVIRFDGNDITSEKDVAVPESRNMYLRLFGNVYSSIETKFERFPREYIGRFPQWLGATTKTAKGLQCEHEIPSAEFCQTTRTLFTDEGLVLQIYVSANATMQFNFEMIKVF